MFFTYILKSLKDNKHYIGHTQDINKRLEKHNKGLIKSTKNRTPFKLIYSEQYTTKQQAYKREMEIKSMKGGIQFKALLEK